MSGHMLIVDDHEVVRRGLRSLLSSRPEWKICGEASDGLEAIEEANALRRDVVLMDISIPRMDGLEAKRIIRKEPPGSKVVIVSQNDPLMVERQAQEVDAKAYVAKSDLSQRSIPTLDRLGAVIPPKASRGPSNSGSRNAVIRVAREGESISLEAHDEGRGISPENFLSFNRKTPAWECAACGNA